MARLISFVFNHRVLAMAVNTMGRILQKQMDRSTYKHLCSSMPDFVGNLPALTEQRRLLQSWIHRLLQFSSAGCLPIWASFDAR